MHIEYRFSPTDNDGRITSMKDHVTGEDVTYQYDSLNRLFEAYTTAGPQWGLSFGYDGWGNRTSQTITAGSGPPYNTLNFDGSTNRITTPGYGYDANGNVTATPGWTYAYDAANRLTQETHGANVANKYAYSPDNKRVWGPSPYPPQHTNIKGVYYLYSVTGQKLGEYELWEQHNGQDHALVFVESKVDIYFGSKLLRSGDTAIRQDRLGTVGATPRYPYGENAGRFATYERDSAYLDYADQRWYSSIMGRFMTPDPYVASAGPAEPGSWNRYVYVKGDPVNYNDPAGLMERIVGAGQDGTSGWDAEYGSPFRSGDFERGFGGPVDASSPGESRQTRPSGSGVGTPQNKGGWNTDPNVAAETAWQYLTSIWEDCLNYLGVATLERRPRRRGIGGAGPDRCGIASSDQNLPRDRWLGVVQWPPPFARSSACRSVPCDL